MTGRSNQTSIDPLLGESQAIQRLRHVINAISPLNTTVLVYGEYGTEKEIVARMIHEKSPMAGGHFIPVPISDIPNSLLEGALFGHEKLLSGFSSSQQGYFDRAGEGTLFLDEIGDMDAPTQVKLLQILQFSQFERVGGRSAIPTNARIVAVTSKNLKKLVRNGEFRQDLFYRLNFVTMEIPPLRERADDIPLLARHFVKKISKKYNIRGVYLKPDTIAVMKNYHWPGNVRQLENFIEILVALPAASGMDINDFPIDGTYSHVVKICCDHYLPFAEAKTLFEHECFQRLLQAIQYNFSETIRGERETASSHSVAHYNSILSSLSRRYIGPTSEIDRYN